MNTRRRRLAKRRRAWRLGWRVGRDRFVAQLVRVAAIELARQIDQELSELIGARYPASPRTQDFDATWAQSVILAGLDKKIGREDAPGSTNGDTVDV